MTLYIGVMSGTSLDGLDIALVELAPAIKLIATHYIPMPDSCLLYTSPSPRD